MWDQIIEYLKDPLLVIKVQNFFGVTYKSSQSTHNESCEVIKSDEVTAAGEDVELRHRRVPSNTSSSSSCDTDWSSDGAPELQCAVTNRFWYWLFVLGTELGDEIFYATFIPFWFWNIDGAVGRRVVLVWTIIMYIGQGFKDVIRWPRPGYPVKQLQTKWAVEYGMPSTHAMVGVCIPFSVLLYTAGRYQYPVHCGLVLALAWCALICVSRVYLGMHSVLDIAAGLALASALMLPLVPAADALDPVLLTSRAAPLGVLGAAVLLLVLHPHSDTWTPTRGDTTMIVSVCAGILTGSWANYQLGNLKASELQPPYEIIWPSVEMLGCTVLRTVLGLCGVVATRAAGKALGWALALALRRAALHAVLLELGSRFVTYGLIGFNTTFVFPNVFALLHIDRPTYYTEI